MTRKQTQEKLSSIEKLVEFNRYLNRRLHLVHSARRREPFLVDSEDEEIKSKPFGLPDIVISHQQPYNPALPWTYERPYWFSTVKPYLWRNYLTHNEVHLVLGNEMDSLPVNIIAMCEASTGGPEPANAYLLGPKMHGIHRDGDIIIPVQYYKIDSNRHEELGIESNKKYLKLLVDRVKEDRKIGGKKK